MVYIWIDDIRRPPSRLTTKGVRIASSFDEAINYIIEKSKQLCEISNSILS